MCDRKVHLVDVRFSPPKVVFSRLIDLGSGMLEFPDADWEAHEPATSDEQLGSVTRGDADFEMRDGWAPTPNWVDGASAWAECQAFVRDYNK